MEFKKSVKPKPYSLNKSKNKPYNQLYLKINVNRAADLVISDISIKDECLNKNNLTKYNEINLKKSINPVLVVLMNNINIRTSKKHNTNQPSWDDTLMIPLYENKYSQLLTLTIWDKHKRYKNYLGELRLKVKDIFYEGSKFKRKKELQWYKIHSNEQYHSFISGSLLLSFELIIKKKLKKKYRKDKIKSTLKLNDKFDSIDMNNVPSSSLKNSTNNSSERNSIFEDGGDDADSIPESTFEINDDNCEKLFDNWLKSLIYPEIDSNLINSNDQGFYPDTNGFSNSLFVDNSDIESIINTISPSIDKNETSSQVDVNSLLLSLIDRNLHNLSLKDNYDTNLLGNGLSSVSDLYLSTDSSHTTQEIDMMPKKPKSKKKHRFRKSKLNVNLIDNNLGVSNRKVLGVIFIEVVSCSDLPPLRNITRISFDMDPFVVVTFGKKTFRTSWKRHTLNPVFNERLAFEILPHETNFNIQFHILDKDHFTFHDKVASVTLPMKVVTDMATSSSNSSYLSGNSNISLNDISDNNSNTDYTNFQLLSSNIDDQNLDESVKKKKFKKSKKATVTYADTSNFKTLDLALNLHSEKYVDKYNPKLKIRVRFESYESIRKKFWNILLTQYNVNDNKCYDYIELISFLDTLGCNNTEDVVNSFYELNHKLPHAGDLLTFEEIIDSLEHHVTSRNDSKNDKLFEIEKCPICFKKKLLKKHDIDIITHVALCASKDWRIVNKLLVSSYVTPQIATKRWFSKVLIKLTYGKYKLGSNSANILVQDRTTGIIMEEKMGIYVRLGIRLLYRGFDKAKKRRVRNLLKKLSFKQGIKFDSPQLKNDIESFIKFHKLDLSECLETDSNNYKSFNDFFYRKLKPDARPIESPDDNRIVISPADCRCTAFSTVNRATELWIKGRNFSVAKLFNGNFNNLENTDIFKADSCSLGIFRLAPQDYHRFHSPVDGIIKNIKYISGEYYTVNPMAIRSELDVFGENVRSIIPIKTKIFGTIIMIAVGAMMVGSIVLTVKEGDSVKRGDEIGYFKFGGSTILLLFEKKFIKFDSDLINNSNSCIETLIRVGQSIGHLPNVKEYERSHIDFGKQSKNFKLNLIRVITGGDLTTTKELSNWESSNIKITSDDVAEAVDDIEVSGDVGVSDDIELSDGIGVSDDIEVSDSIKVFDNIEPFDGYNRENLFT